MSRAGPVGRRSRLMVWTTLMVAAALAAIWSWVDAPARVHWDEPGYWYAAAYSSFREILGGDFEPSGIRGFSASRIGHILLLKLVTAVGGPGAASLRWIEGLYLLMLVSFVVVTHRILRLLMPDPGPARAAVTLGALTPVLVYLAFKTLAEIPAALLAALAAFAFLRSLQRRAAPWLGVVAVALVGVSFTKNHLVILDASMGISLILCRGCGWRVGRILKHGLVSGTAAVVLFFAMLRAAGIPLSRYLGLVEWMSGLSEPAGTGPMELGLECGPFLAALPLAFLSPHRGHAWFFSLWFLLATVPLLFSTHVETRYLVGNFVPLAGLVHLSLEGAAPHVRRAWARRRVATAALGAAIALVTLLSTALSQRVMYYGVQKGDLERMLQRLDETHGRGRYAIVTPSEFTTFLFLRFVHPERPVYTVFTPSPPNHRDPRVWAEFQRTYFGARAVQTPDQLKAIGEDIVFLGTESDLTVADFRAMIGRLPPCGVRRAAERFLAGMRPHNPLLLSWMWTEPRVRLSDGLRVGHYCAMRVTISSSGNSGGPASARHALHGSRPGTNAATTRAPPGGNGRSGCPSRGGPSPGSAGTTATRRSRA